MKLAHIPPRGLEVHALRQRFHLVLAQVDYPEYLETYQHARGRGDYIILDNGAAEGATVGDALLMHRAQQLRADEIVIPDVMGRSNDTVRRMWRFFDNLNEMTYPWKDYRYMAVAQGGNEAEVKKCIEEFVKCYNIKVLGIPRHLVKTLANHMIRVDLAKWLQEEYPKRFEIHFLGAAPTFPGEPFVVSRYNVPVRSMDTSLAFNYAIAGRELKRPVLAGEPIVNVVTRPEGYWSRRWNTAVKTPLLVQNLQTLEDWADV